VLRLCKFYPGICLTTEEKARKNLSQGKKNLSQVKKILSQGKKNLSQVKKNLSQCKKNLSQVKINLSQVKKNLSQVKKNLSQGNIFYKILRTNYAFITKANQFLRMSYVLKRVKHKPRELLQTLKFQWISIQRVQKRVLASREV